MCKRTRKCLGNMNNEPQERAEMKPVPDPKLRQRVGSSGGDEGLSAA